MVWFDIKFEYANIEYTTNLMVI